MTRSRAITGETIAINRNWVYDYTSPILIGVLSQTDQYWELGKLDELDVLIRCVSWVAAS